MAHKNSKFVLPSQVDFWGKPAAVTERVVLLDNGRIIADGHSRKIMWDSKLMTEHGLEVPAKFRT